MGSSTDNNRVSRAAAGHQSSPAELPRLCAGGCGFFGTAENHGLCSKCCAVDLKQKMAKSVLDEQSKINSSTVERIDKPVDTVDNGNNPSVSVRSRCGLCRKKVGLLGFKCRCGGNFCGMHRYAEAHLCKIDYKKAGKFAIAEENPLCRADKIRDRI